VRLFSQNTKVEALAKVPLFQGLSRQELERLAKATEDVEVEAGKVLCREGEAGREFFLVLEGEAEVTKEGKHLATHGPGAFFGEVALVEKVPRIATVTARTPLRFFVMTSQSFVRLLDSYPEIEHKVLRALARRVYETLSETTA
jgi:CRP/FNR family transcriptional regulator, cyclic AMP receptor protein